MFTPHKACCMSDGKLTRTEAFIRGWCKICKQDCPEEEGGAVNG